MRRWASWILQRLVGIHACAPVGLFADCTLDWRWCNALVGLRPGMSGPSSASAAGSIMKPYADVTCPAHRLLMTRTSSANQPVESVSSRAVAASPPAPAASYLRRR